MKYTHEDVMEFIRRFCESDEDALIRRFTNGCCYWFAHILAEVFNGTIYYDTIENHFFVLINGRYYDITGEYHVSYNQLRTNIHSWNEYQEYDSLHALRIVRDCIYLGAINKDEE